jgi:hypothetical protein
VVGAVKISEADWQRRVIDAAKLFGWRYAHFRPAQTSKGWRTAMSGDKGFPDLVLVRPPRVLFVELKSDDGLPSEAQLLWFNDLASSGEAYIWRPRDWTEVYTTLAKA